MKRLVQSLVLSATVAAATLVPVMEASAGERWREQRPRNPQHHHRQDATGDLVAAGVLGLAIGIIAATAIDDTPAGYPDTADYPPAPYGGASVAYGGQIEPWTRDWYRYCAARYQSFDPQTGTFRGYDGYDHFCVAN
ncbi:BA14K family protein [Aquibium sp. ELW1220]|uniref:BA14K family protein n=1 Tax=Aquibium sp. ELW1220 TaxID=2976766 RepID=UPI0025AF9BC8|nr:BA14K family protein [Aquibium sp. ELW1220]MDN2579344.1 BA14K family protein [Aquibium sp. ELW1220]